MKIGWPFLLFLLLLLADLLPLSVESKSRFVPLPETSERLAADDFFDFLFSVGFGIVGIDVAPNLFANVFYNEVNP